MAREWLQPRSRAHPSNPISVGLLFHRRPTNPPPFIAKYDGFEVGMAGQMTKSRSETGSPVQSHIALKGRWGSTDERGPCVGWRSRRQRYGALP
jgi:hypothetical protein